ncbi:hypothetical protein CIW83_08695 [Tissierella sp. P1]|uniref:DUF2225 domain-containing protein n=1 Tax=Tissierella carlieri TaxID=689904 RepID=A0ABT1S8U9_9FIRM|nr:MULTISPECIES: DUF2225 domain-containing protein [Tissierella]MCQ4922902.1 DUF2225 domain-containing protein [Tissierella carlieri]OZV12455.1 hypothetical protein CIW83_08695 [Tissierella sp. P1]
MTEQSELFDKKVECPICKKEFSTKKVKTSRLRLLKRDEDFLNHYSAENPIKYSIFVCPNCGYAASENKFNDIKKDQIGIIIDNISSRWNKRDFGGIRDLDEAIESYKLALLAGTLLKAKKLEQGNICLSLGWLYRLKEEKNEEVRFLKLARDQFIEAYNTESLSGTNMDDSKLSYLIGELSRRLSEKEEALSWFNTCLNLASTRMNPALNDMAREQWRLVKEM